MEAEGEHSEAAAEKASTEQSEPAKSSEELFNDFYSEVNKSCSTVIVINYGCYTCATILLPNAKKPALINNYF